MKEEKINFFKKVWYSITKIEKYPEMAAQGFVKAIGYLGIMAALFAIVLSIGMTYQLSTQETELGTELVNTIKSAIPDITSEELYLSIFFASFLTAFGILLILIAINALYVSIIGYISSLIARIKMRYIAIYNMSIYSLTLSIILCMIYIAINTFISFEIQYFDVMYSAVAAIYIVAAILLLKEDVIKRQLELMKIMQEQEIIREQLEEEEQKEKNEKEKEERKKKDKEEQTQEDASGEPCTFLEERNE